MANYVAGEIREPSKNFLWSIVAVLAITVVFTFVASFATLAIFGQFASRYTYVWYANLGSQLKINIPMVPSLGLFTGVLAGPYGSWLSVLMASSGAFFIFKSQSMNMLISSRMIFALSFDRMLPTGLSNVNDRFHSPHWAIITVMAIAYLSAVGTVVAPWIAVLNLFAGILWKYFTVGWAAMIMPYSRPDIYERGFTAKLIGIPLTTIIGAISTCLNAFLFYLVLTSLSGQWSSLLLQSGIFAGGLLYYTAAFAYNKSKGIDMAALWQEIPPA
jgi:amino acid transporter